MVNIGCCHCRRHRRSVVVVVEVVNVVIIIGVDIEDTCRVLFVIVSTKLL